MDLPVSVANKQLTQKLNPLDATLTKNTGVGSIAALNPANLPTRKPEGDLRSNSFPYTFLATPHPLTPFLSHSYKNHRREGPLPQLLTVGCHLRSSCATLEDYTNSQIHDFEPSSLVIVGRPNVGKSTLFNRLTGTRRSIVTNEPGITRDRIYGKAEWRGRTIEVVDTGGLIPDDKALIPQEILRQAHVAIDKAALLVLVVDSQAGITPLDEELARLLRITGKPFVVAVNKVDAPSQEVHAAAFHRIGVPVFPIAAEHGTGVDDLLDAALEETKAVESLEEEKRTGDASKSPSSDGPTSGNPRCSTAWSEKNAPSSRRFPERRWTRSISK